MYSHKVIESNERRLFDELGIRLKRYPVSEVQEIRAHLESNINEKGELRRSFTAWESEFIKNEQLLCAIDFHYFCPRYCLIALDGGGVGKLNFAASQRVALERHIGPAEEEMMALWEKHQPVTGLLFYWHKARQLYATALCRALTMHRMITCKDVRALAASVDEDKIMELYDRDKLIYENLPFYLRPETTYDVKGEHVYYNSLNSRLLYQVGTQKSGMGQGRQFDLHHLTECAFWDEPELHIDYVLNPAIPQSVRTLGIRESSANGRGNWWHTETEDARLGRNKLWRYIFIPYYIIETKNILQPPDDWQPSELSLLHAKMVSERSPEITGYCVDLSRPQLYWYEVMRAEAQRKGKLNLFLTNHCATPEESFQHTNISAFSPELLNELRLKTKVGVPFEVTFA